MTASSTALTLLFLKAENVPRRLYREMMSSRYIWSLSLFLSSPEGPLLYEGDLFLRDLQVGGEIFHQPALDVLPADHFGLLAAELLDAVIQIRAKAVKIVAILDCGEVSESGRILNNLLQRAGVIASAEGFG